MVRYMYIAKIDHNFTRIKELLVLANKYQVLELVNYCSSKIFESLSEDNALEIGMFGEMHNSDILINRCAKYICSISFGLSLIFSIQSSFRESVIS